MKKMLLILTVVMVGSLAANAAPVQFNFTFDGFCDAMETTQYSPGANIANIFLTGTHDLSPCGIPSNFVGGFKHDVATPEDPAVPFSGLTFPIPSSGRCALPYSCIALSTASCLWASYFSDGSGNFLNTLSCLCRAKVEKARWEAKPRVDKPTTFLFPKPRCKPPA
jgi:hypothetical protein